MIGGLTSSLSLAQRTATKARATMDTMARQMVTGQKVSSVKDDGAAWSRASALKSKQVEYTSNETRLSLYAAHGETSAAWGDSEREFVERMRAIYLQASLHQPGSNVRLALKAEADALVAGLSPGFGTNSVSALTSHAALDSSHGLLAGLSAVGRHFDGLWINVLSPALVAAPLDTASTATISAQIATLDTHLNNLRGIDQDNGRQLRAVESIDAQNSRYSDVTDAAIGSLTDADMGKASAARAQADTRQQLALQTIQQAISAYGNFAGGLLGNVQRTQRAIA